MDDEDLKRTLGGMVMAFCWTLPPAFGQRYADALRVCARANADAGHTSVDTLLRELAKAAEDSASQARPGH